MLRIKDFFSRLIKNMVLPCLLGVLILVAVLLQLFGNAFWSGLGSNLIAEFIGAVATIYGIDYVFKKREELRMLPIKASSYEDVRLITHWALALWRDAYFMSVGDSKPKSWLELFKQENLNRILSSLDVRKPSKTLQEIPWIDYFDYEMERIKSHVEKILERHGYYLDPNLYGSIYVLDYYGKHKLANIMASDKLTGVPRVTCLGSYALIVPQWFEAVIKMHEWTVEMHAYLTKNNIKNIHEPFYFTEFPLNQNPSARFDVEDLNSQIVALQEWQNNQK